MKNIATLCLLFLSFIGFAQDELFVSESSGFKVFFPDAPTEQKQNVPTALGEIDMYMYMYQSTDEAFMVSQNDYPADKVDYSDKEVLKGMLEGALNGSYNNMAQGSGAEAVIEEREFFTFQDKYSAVRGKGHIGNIYIRNFIVINGNRMYQILAMGFGKYPESIDANKFINSFKIIEK